MTFDAPPTAFATTIGDVHGDAGRAWLEQLPDLLDATSEKWDLTPGRRFDPLTYSYVTRATRRDGTPCVVKATVPGRDTDGEIAALEVFAGCGSVDLLASDRSTGVLLLERLEPGRSLLCVAEGEATRAAAEVMRALRSGAAGSTSAVAGSGSAEPQTVHAFPTTAAWAEGYGRWRGRPGGGTDPLPSRVVDAAERLSFELHASPTGVVLLHGDLHHRNILSATRSPWLSIDPKGVLGEPEYETGALLRNPMPEMQSWPDLDHVLRRRVDLLADALDYDARRVAAWGAAQAVLSAIWSLEDHGSGWEAAARCAEILMPLVGGAPQKR